jgi:hypothetical protein
MIGTQGYHIGNRKERKKTPPTPKPKKQKTKN